MAWIEASAAGGSTGGGNTIMVTCSESFAGLPITCTNGLTTKTLNCPSTAPYVIQFTDIVADEWTISGTIDGTTYSTTVEVGDIFTTVLESGFEWQTWVDLSQNYHSADYNSLAEVFADEGAVHELMTIHVCCDYLIDAVTDDINTIDDFCANDTAMKWIGLRDYVCDGLTAINGVEAKFLASQYWERYLKDHVPVMTANNAPYGTLTGDGGTSGHDIFKAFDGDDSTYWQTQAEGHYLRGLTYAFVNPTCVKRVKIRCLNAMTEVAIRVGNATSNLTVIKEVASVNANEDVIIDVPNDDYYMYIAVEGYVNSGATQIATLQFYGRALDVSVPVMTSNTAPFGVASANRVYSEATAAWKSFNGDDSTGYSNGAAANLTDYLQFEFPSKMRLKMLVSKIDNNSLVEDITLRCSNDGLTFTDIDTYHYTTRTIIENVSVNEDYKIFRVQNAKALASGWFSCLTLQFYGVDYSEREFEPNTNKKWLYDHGLELEPMTAYRGNVVKGNDSIKLTYNSIAASCSVTMDLTPYSLARAKVTEFTNVYNYLMVTNSEITQAVTQNQITSNYAPNNISLNVSAIDETLPLIVQSQQVNGCSQEITELWVE